MLLSMTWSVNGKGVWPYIAETDVFDDLGINIGSPEDFAEEFVEHAIERRIFQATFAGFAQWSTDGEGDYYIVRILGCSERQVCQLDPVNVENGKPVSLLHLPHATLAWGDVTQDGRETLRSHIVTVLAGGVDGLSRQ